MKDRRRTFYTKTPKLFSLVPLLYLAAGLCGIANGQAPMNAMSILPVEVNQQLQKQESAMKNFSVNVTERRQQNDAAHPAGQKTFTISVDGNRLREHRHTEFLENQEKRTQDIDRSFDGHFVYVGDPKQSKRNLMSSLRKYATDDPSDPDLSGMFFQFPYLNAAGFDAPEFFPEIQKFSGVRSLALKYLDESESTQIKNEGDNLRVTVLIKVPFYRTEQTNALKHTVSFLLDSTHGYSIAERKETTATGERVLDVTCGDWRYYTNAEVWLPAKCVVAYYTDSYKLDSFAKEPIETFDYVLNNIEFGSQTVPFDLSVIEEYKRPGSRIEDRTVPEARNNRYHEVVYTVGADGKLLRASAVEIMSKRSIWLAIFILATPPLIFFLFQFKKSFGK